MGPIRLLTRDSFPLHLILRKTTLVISTVILLTIPVVLLPINSSARATSNYDSWAQQLQKAEQTGLFERFDVVISSIWQNEELADFISNSPHIDATLQAIKSGSYEAALTSIEAAKRTRTELSSSAVRLLDQVTKSEPFQSVGTLIRSLMNDSQFRTALSEEQLAPQQKSLLFDEESFWDTCKNWASYGGRVVLRAGVAVGVVVVTAAAVEASPATAPAVLQFFTIPALSFLINDQTTDPTPGIGGSPLQGDPKTCVEGGPVPAISGWSFMLVLPLLAMGVLITRKREQRSAMFS